MHPSRCCGHLQENTSQNWDLGARTNDTSSQVTFPLPTCDRESIRTKITIKGSRLVQMRFRRPMAPHKRRGCGYDGLYDLPFSVIRISATTLRQCSNIHCQWRGDTIPNVHSHSAIMSPCYLSVAVHSRRGRTLSFIVPIITL